MSYTKEGESGSVSEAKSEKDFETHVVVDQAVCIHFVLLRVKVGVTSSVRTNDEVGQHLVDTRIRLILDDAKNVETRENGFGELDVLREGDCWVVASSDRIGSCDDSATSLKSCDDTGFRN